MTYKRETYLPRIIKCFLTQDYSNKELIILNDDPDVNYVCDHPEIKITNWKHRFENLREKANVCTWLCNGEAFIPIGDDDIFLPHATSRFAEEIGDDPFVAAWGFWKAHDKNKLGRVWKYGGIASLYMCRLKFFEEMGGYKLWKKKLNKDKNGYDLVLHPEDFIRRVKKRGRFKSFQCTKDDAFFTWIRDSDHTMWADKNPEKYKIKDRDPKVIRL